MSSSRLLRTYSVEHRALVCARPFDEAHKRLVDTVPPLNLETVSILTGAERDKVALARREWPKPWLFLVRDHGALTAVDGGGCEPSNMRLATHLQQSG